MRQLHEGGGLLVLSIVEARCRNQAAVNAAPASAEKPAVAANATPEFC